MSQEYWEAALLPAILKHLKLVDLNSELSEIMMREFPAPDTK